MKHVDYQYFDILSIDKYPIINQIMAAAMSNSRQIRSLFMKDWHIGCSGFHYKDWRGPFYPTDLAQRKWFDYYCEHFKTLELNVTFYRFPRLPFLQNWHRQAPPNYNYTDEKLEKIIAGLNLSFKNVFEPRHVTWWNADVYKKLAEHNITFCGMSHPSLPDDIIENTDMVYYRFHGVPDLYRSRYTVDFLQKVVDNVNQCAGIKEAWCYFNNDYDATGVFNAKEMMALV